MTITNQQKEFIWRYHGLCVKIDDIAKTLGVPRKTLSQWENELKEHWMPVSEIRELYILKKIEGDLKEFHDWFIALQDGKKCTYCGITEPEIKELFESKKIETKRARGPKLELDRKSPNDPYTYDNTVYACYWCNQAKTDTFTHEEALEIGKVIAKIWKARKSS